MSHLHWEFFGVTLSTPLADDSNEERDDSEQRSVELVLIMDEAAPIASFGSSSDHVPSAVVCAPIVEAVWNPEPVPRPPGCITSIPLCDSARLERTGVLLA